MPLQPEHTGGAGSDTAGGGGITPAAVMASRRLSLKVLPAAQAAVSAGSFRTADSRASGPRRSTQLRSVSLRKLAGLSPHSPVLAWLGPVGEDEAGFAGGVEDQDVSGEGVGSPPARRGGEGQGGQGSGGGDGGGEGEAALG